MLPTPVVTSHLRSPPGFRIEMSILHRPSVPALVFRSFASMMASLFLLASCSSQREVWQDIEGFLGLA